MNSLKTTTTISFGKLDDTRSCVTLTSSGRKREPKAPKGNVRVYNVLATVPKGQPTRGRATTRVGMRPALQQTNEHRHQASLSPITK